jgi:cytochrome P450
MVLLQVLVFALAIFMAKFIYRWIKFILLANKIPKSAFDTSIKNLMDIAMGDNKNFYEKIKKAYEPRGLTRTWFGPMLVVEVTEPEDVKIVLNSRDCVDKPYLVTEFPKLPQGTLFGHVKPWHAHRKILNPYFGLQSLRTIVPIFNKKVKILMDNLEKMEGKGEFNVFHNMSALTLETILSVMEHDVDIQNQEIKSRDVFIENLEV